MRVLTSAFSVGERRQSRAPDIVAALGVRDGFEELNTLFAPVGQEIEIGKLNKVLEVPGHVRHRPQVVTGLKRTPGSGIERGQCPVRQQIARIELQGPEEALLGFAQPTGGKVEVAEGCVGVRRVWRDLDGLRECVLGLVEPAGSGLKRPRGCCRARPWPIGWMASSICSIASPRFWMPARALALRTRAPAGGWALSAGTVRQSAGRPRTVPPGAIVRQRVSALPRRLA